MLLRFLLVILTLLFFNISAQAQSQRNPCTYIGTSIGSCIPVGYGLGTGTEPMPVGGLANASAPTFLEGMPGYLSFDLSGNLRVAASFTPSGTQNVNLTQILGSAVSASNPLFISPSVASTTMATSAPTATVFSSLLASNASRKACLIQNTGTTLGYVYFGATGSATTSNSFTLSAGQAISCSNNNITLTDNVAGTCASSTCAFVISSQ